MAGFFDQFFRDTHGQKSREARLWNNRPGLPSVANVLSSLRPSRLCVDQFGRSPKSPYLEEQPKVFVNGGKGQAPNLTQRRDGRREQTACGRASFPFHLLSLGICLFADVFTASAREKVTYEDDITPILRNNCFKCHNPDKTKGELDLTTYSAVLKGGGSGKAVLPGDAAGSKLYKAIARLEEPFMPDKGPKLPDGDIATVKKWIDGGLLEKSTSQAVAANRPKLAPSLGATLGKPAGPAVLPVDWRLEPVLRTERATTVTALAASPWSPLIAVGGQHQLLVYHTDTLELAGVLPFPEVNPICAQFSRDSRLLLVGGGHGAKFGFADVYDVATGQRLIRVGNEFDTVLAADLNSDQTQVALGGPAKRVKVFSTRDGHLLHDLKKHTDWVTAIQFSPDSVLLATGDRNGGLVVWEADSGQELYTLTGHQAAITSVSWRDDSDALLSASEDGSIRVWEMREGKQLANWSAHKEGVLDARFTHDARIVSCGRDKQIALWDAAGAQQRKWPAGGDLPVRATFTHDGARVLASSWQGTAGVWTAADGKPVGEITSNPPTLAERLELSTREAERRESVAAKAEEAFTDAEDAAAKIRATLAAQDRTSPAFQFAAAALQARHADRKAAEESNRGLEQLKAVAAKSAANLAAAETEAAKLQAALEKVDKFSKPYQQLARQIETAGQQISSSAAKLSAAEKSLADKSAAINAAAAELVAKILIADRARDQATADLDSLGKQTEAATRAVAVAHTMADQDQARLAQHQALASATKTLAAAESNLAQINQALAGTNQDSPEGRQLTQQLEIATQQLAEIRVAQELSQKSLGDLKAAAEKSAAVVAANEADIVKLKATTETAQQALETIKSNVLQLEVARTNAAEAAGKEIEALRASVAETAAALAAAKADQAGLQAKLEKTEKFSDAFKAATSRLEAANHQVALVREPADRDAKEAAELRATLEKIAASVAASEAEATKALATLAKGDPGFQRGQELERQLETASLKSAETKAAAEKARQSAADTKDLVGRIRVGQAHFALDQARETLTSRQFQQEKLVAAETAAVTDYDRAQKELNEARTVQTAQVAKIKSLQNEVLNTLKAAGANRGTLKPVERTISTPVQTARDVLVAARTVQHELDQRVQSLTRSTSDLAARLAAARSATADSARQLATERDRVDRQAADYTRLKATAKL